jgi:predicted O-linked N-acetylglucosamine transferase (SPINDLY family)
MLVRSMSRKGLQNEAPDEMIDLSGGGSGHAGALPSASSSDTTRDNRVESPATGTGWSLLGRQQLQKGLVQPAIVSFGRATQLEPAVALHWGQLGKALAAQQRYDAAEPVLQRACQLDPALPALWLALAYVLQQQNRAEAAIEACGRALAAHPEHIPAAITQALLLQPVYSGASDLAAWRNRFGEGLAHLHSRKSKWRRAARGILALELNNFYLAYQGQDSRALQSSCSDLLSALLGAAVPGLQAPIALRREPSKIRVGFMSSNLRACTVGSYFASWITDLPRDRFEVCTLFTGGIADAHAQMLARRSDRYAPLVGPVDQVARAVRSLGLDVLIFPDVGMAIGSTLFANLRLAPVQCAAWGHPVTTGSAFVDFFLSCADMEPPRAASDYRERLVLLPGLGTRYPAPPAIESAARASLGLPPDKRIYVCPQSLYKIHPDTDELFLDILARDEQAALLFFGGLTEGQRRAFLRRLQSGLNARGLPRRQQIKLMPLLGRDDFRRVLAACDIMLDTPHWSGGSTTLDALCAGLPIVTLPGHFMRGRQSAAMLRIVGVEELIARDARDYVEIALRVAGDPTYRRVLSSRISAGLPKLIERAEPVEALAAALERMVAGIG